MAATYTVKQVANILGYSTNSIYTFLKEKRIKGVRVGRGRFRIPQGELDRLLLITKRGSPQASAVVVTAPDESNGAPPLPTSGVVDVVGTSPVPLRAFGGLRLPNIFDWFAGAGALVAGVAMYLFNPSFDGVAANQVLPLFYAVRTIFIGSGIGIIATSMTGKGETHWNKMFHVLLGFAGMIFAILFWRTGDIDGAFIYGMFGILVLATGLFPWGGLASFTLYLTLLAISSAIVPILGPADVHVVPFLQQFQLTSWQAGLVFGAAALIFSILVWWGYYRARAVFWFCTWGAAIVYFALSFWYAEGRQWSRPFFLTVVAITSMLAPPWEAICLTKNKREHVLTLGIFGGILVILIAGIIIVHLMQLNAMETIKRENAQKVAYAASTVDSALESVTSTIVGVATNKELVAAIEKRNAATLKELSRIILEGNHNIGRVGVLNRIGDVVHVYPVGTENQSNMAFRDYFIGARDTQKPYISDVFESAIDPYRRKTVVVAVPLFDNQQSFAGVVVASLDLETIGWNLQKIPLAERKEYVVVVDTKGNRIIHPDKTLIGVEIEAQDPTRRGIAGQRGVDIGETYGGNRAIVAYDTVNSLHWGIGIKTPMAYLYELTNVASMAVYAVALIAVIVATLLLQGAHIRWRRSQVAEGNSP